MNSEFEGKTVFITGGSRGIGRSIKTYFEMNGAKTIAPTRNELDLLSRESISAYMDSLHEIPDIVIHCAGLNIKSELDRIDLSDVDSVFQVNFDSIVQILNHLVDGMKKKGGKIILVTSLYSFVSREGRLSYSSSKCALDGLCRTLALELAPYSILINCVAPGYVMTNMTRKNLSDSEIEEIKKLLPTGRFQEETEISSLVGFLCSDSNKSITGQSIAIDGGFLCR